MKKLLLKNKILTFILYCKINYFKLYKLYKLQILRNKVLRIMLYKGK